MTRFVSLACVLVSGTLGMAQSRPAYPASKIDPVVDNLHGVNVPDPYRWLEEGDNPAVREWTEKQNAYTRSFLDALPGRAELRARLDQLMLTTALGVPHPAHGKYFYTKREASQNQPVLYVRDGVNGTDRVLIDINALTADGTTAMDWYYPSHDGKYLAYGLSAGGNEQSTLRVRDVATGKDLPVRIERTRACSLAWLPDSSGFYYTRYAAPGTIPAGEENYHRRVYFHNLGDDPAKDPEIFGSGRPKEDWPNVDLGPDGRWLAITQQQGWAKTEVYLIDTKSADKKPITLVEKVDAVFQPHVRNDAIYIRTNHNAPRYQLYRVNPNHPERANWKLVLAESPDVLERFEVIGKTLVTVSMKKAASALRFYRLGSGPAELIRQAELPTLGSITGLGAEPEGTELFYGFQSFTAPTSVYRVSLADGKSDVWASVKADIAFDKYEVTQVEYPSKDGTKVTMFLASKKGLPRDGNNPTLLYGYGGFNISLTPAFSATRFAFLEKGGVLAIANLRGGGEYGEEWHQAGMLGNKQNVFDDFIAAAEWLIANKVTNPNRLAIQGGSNGGLLMGAAMTQRPDLFRAVICQVPLLDMVRYHKFLIARLWIPEYGSPDDSAHFQWLHAYSPYHRVKDGTKYPATLIATADGDSRVDPLHARKMAARLQAANAGPHPQLVRLESKAGHGAGKPRAKVLDELVDVFSFLFAQLGMNSN
ncbi:MAG: prolyl oligopeptidase family serine peptidase [Gemmataceae bacterium]|nr:prolyl oligopeptidase family serine peptidase [Gemmataceae bacterium]